MINGQKDIRTDKYGFGLVNANWLFSRTQQEAQVWSTKCRVRCSLVFLPIILQLLPLKLKAPRVLSLDAKTGLADL